MLLLLFAKQENFVTKFHSIFPFALAIVATMELYVEWPLN